MADYDLVGPRGAQQRAFTACVMNYSLGFAALLAIAPFLFSFSMPSTGLPRAENGKRLPSTRFSFPVLIPPAEECNVSVAGSRLVVKW